MFRTALISIFMFSVRVGSLAQSQRKDYTDQPMRLVLLTDNKQYREAINGYKNLQAQPHTPGWLKAASESKGTATNLSGCTSAI